MTNAEDTKREKAKKLRYKKPIARGLNLMTIKGKLYDIQEECEEVHWFWDTDEETLINALDGNEDEAYEFKMMFSDLCGEIENMLCDMNEEWVPKCFDIFFVAAGAGDEYGGLMGYDAYEQDYFRLNSYDILDAEDESSKTLKRLTKDELIAASRQCFRIFQSYISLTYRYDCLKATMDILKDKNTGYLEQTKRLNDLYDIVDEKTDGFKYLWNAQKELKILEDIFNSMPQEAWIQ